MKWIPMILLAAMLGGCATKQMATTAQWNEAAAQEARAEVEKSVRLITAMDLEGLKAEITQDGFVTIYDLDFEGKPVRMGTRDEGIQYLKTIFDEAKKMGATLDMGVPSIHCRATSTIAYCVMEYDFSATMPDGQKMTQPSRTSLVLRKGEDGWKWMHWHTSLATVPAPPAAPSEP